MRIVAGLSVVIIVLLGYFLLGESRLEKDAKAVGTFVAAIQFCDFEPRRGALDSIAGRYDFDHRQSEQFRDVFDAARNLESQNIETMTDLEATTYCAEMREFAQTIPFGLVD